MSSSRHPDPDVPDHRHLGRAAPDLRLLQVLPLHAPGLGPFPGRDPRIYLDTGTTEIPAMMRAARGHRLPLGVQQLLWLAMFVSFAVKVPMWPFHTWLPDAHVEAPTAGSVLLAGVLLKLGGYGFLRFSLPMLPEASAYFAPLRLRALRRRDRLHLAGGADADRHEEADRLLVGGAHGHRHHRHLHAQRAWASRAASCRCSATASSRPPSS